MSPRLRRPLGALGHDMVMAALSFVLSLYLRLGQDIVAFPLRLLLIYGAGFTVTAGAVFWWTGLHRGIWRYASLPDLLAVTRAVTLALLIFFPLMFVLTRLEELPRSTVVINWFVLLALLGGPRFAYRVIKDRGLDLVRGRSATAAVPVLLIGVRDAAAAFIQAMAREPAPLYRVVGVVADGPSRVGREIAGVPVVGTIDEIPAVVAALDRRDRRPQRLIIAGQEFDGATVRRLLDIADGLAIPLARLPRPTEFRETIGERAREIEPVALEDLLGRPQAVLDRGQMAALIAGRRVLVTGAGGTIGAELVRQIAAFGPRHLTLLDNGEYALYTIDRELGERHGALPRRAILGDVRDRARLDEVLAAERPELVFHAAALKHVPMVEANPVEGVLTNVIGTRNLAEASRAAGVSVMVMISTDKAVNPASVMGATKRLAEAVCQALDILEARRPQGTRFVTVRFGNVLGSTGSVVPLFQRQLAAGGPLTVTHPEMTRFFMTVREAVELVLQASALAAGEAEARGRIAVLDMGEPVRIVELARQMIRLAGLKPERDVKIDFIGLRPGEKLHEELLYGSEAVIPTRISGIRLAAPRIADYALLARSLDELAETARRHELDRLLGLLRALVPEFAPGLPVSPPLSQQAATPRPAAARS